MFAFGKYSDLIRKKGNKYTTQDKEDILRIAERNKADLSNIGEQKTDIWSPSLPKMGLGK